MDEYLKILIPSAIGLVTTIVGAFFSARWAVKRAFTERWWERKEKAYTEIIESLYDLLSHSSRCAEDHYNGVVSSSDDKERAIRYQNAYWKIQKMTDIGPFVILKEASTALQKLRDKPILEWNENPPWEIYEADMEHYREALNSIRECAKRDLKI